MRKRIDAGSPGGLGRRIARRRAELGLDRAEVAFRAGVDPGYLAYLEEHPAATAQPSTVRRLAVALATTWEALAGISFGDPAGAGPPAGSAEVAALGEETCYALIAPGGIGRLVFTSGRGPVALPVNFRVLGRDIVFRTGAVWLHWRLRRRRRCLRQPTRTGGAVLLAVAVALAWLSLAFGGWLLPVAAAALVPAAGLEVSARRQARARYADAVTVPAPRRPAGPAGSPRARPVIAAPGEPWTGEWEQDSRNRERVLSGASR